MFKPAILSACVLGALAVTIGAFGAHSLKQIFTPEQLASFETGVKYQFYHCFALAFTGMLAIHFPGKGIKTATYLFTIGTIFFSGSIYLLNFFKAKDIIGLKGLGIITPIGGLMLVGAWLVLFLHIQTSTRK